MIQQKQLVDSSMVSLPEKWIDFTREELMIISNARIQQLDPNKWMPQLIIKVLGIKSNSIKFEDSKFYFNFVDTQKRQVLLTTQGMVALMNRLDWVKESTGLMLEPNIKGYKSPNFKLQNISLQDYIAIDDLFSKALNTQDEKLMNQFCLLLYKPKGNLTPSLSENQKFAIIFWYTGFKAWLKEKYPYVLSGGDDIDIEETNEAETSIEDIIIPLLSALNAGQAVNNEKLRRGKMHELFFELNKQIKMNQKNSKNG